MCLESVFSCLRRGREGESDGGVGFVGWMGECVSEDEEVGLR